MCIQGFLRSKRAVLNIIFIIKECTTCVRNDIEKGCNVWFKFNKCFCNNQNAFVAERTGGNPTCERKSVKKAKLVHDLNLDLTTRTARIVMIKFGRCKVNEFKT